MSQAAQSSPEAIFPSEAVFAAADHNKRIRREPVTQTLMSISAQTYFDFDFDRTFLAHIAKIFHSEQRIDGRTI